VSFNSCTVCIINQLLVNYFQTASVQTAGAGTGRGFALPRRISSTT
jgi:hypothetical protein